MTSLSTPEPLTPDSPSEPEAQDGASSAPDAPSTSSAADPTAIAGETETEIEVMESTPEMAVDSASEAGADAATDSAAATASKPADLSLPECTQALKSRFPALFAGAPKPLKLRIQADIQARAPGVFSRKSLSIFLHRYTGSTSYLQAITRSPTRFDLDGQAAGEITDEHRQVAAEELKRRRAVQDERRAQEAQAEAAARKTQHEARKAQEDAMHERMRLLRAFEATTLTRANFCALKGVKEAELDALLAQARLDAAAWAQREPRPPRRDEGRPGRPGFDVRSDRGRPQGERRPDARGPRPPRRDGAPSQGRGPRRASKPEQG
jgi:ProP effector